MMIYFYHKFEKKNGSMANRKEKSIKKKIKMASKKLLS